MSAQTRPPDPPHEEVDRLELATLEARWIVIGFTLLTMLLLGRLTTPMLLLAVGATLYNLARTVSYLRHWHHLGSRGLIIILDLFLLALLGLVTDWDPLYLSILFLLPITAAGIWFGQVRALLAGLSALLLLGVQLWSVDGSLGRADLVYLLFLAGITAVLVYLIGRIAEIEVEARHSLERTRAEFDRDKARLAALIDGIGDGLIAVTPDRRVTFYNLVATHLVGRPEDNFQGVLLSEVLPARRGIDQFDPVALTLQTGSREVRDDLELQTGHRTVRLYTSVAPILSARGEIAGAILLFRDITVEKAQEEERTAFASIAAHELRTPVTVIEGYLSYLLDSKKLKYDTATRSYVEKAHASVLHLTQLISDILSVTRADNSQLKLAVEPVDLADLIADVMKSVAERAEQKKLALTLDPLPELSELSSDPGKIREILTNLLDNAIKFTDQGGVRVRVSSLDRAVRIEVIDQGMGLSGVDQQRIWQKFYRAENWATRRTSGTGLGLYICKRLVEALGGTIGVSSKVEEGSNFFFTLPLKTLEHEHPAEPAKTPELSAAAK